MRSRSLLKYPQDCRKPVRGERLLGQSKRSAFTLPEITVSLALVAIIGFGAIGILLNGMRLSARNLSANVGHETARICVQRMVQQLEGSVAGFGLLNCNGALLEDIDQTQTGDRQLVSSGTKDAETGERLSNCASGLKFRRLIGPGTLASNVQVNGTTVSVAIPSLAPTDIPNSSDLLWLPYTGESKGYSIASIEERSKTADRTLYSITLAEPVPLPAFVSGTAVSTGTYAAYFLKRSAYAVKEGNLFYFPSATTVGSGSTQRLRGEQGVVLRGNMANAKPFSLFCSGNGSLAAFDFGRVRINLQSYKTSSRREEATTQLSSVSTAVRPAFHVTYDP